MKKEIKIIDCECNGYMCCGGRGIAVYSIKRNEKEMKVCTRCLLSSDKDVKILKYVLKLSPDKLMNFDALGTFCLMGEIKDKKYSII